jgi:hypothetical protein
VYGGGVGKDRAIVSLTKSKRAFQSGDGFPLSYPIIRASPASDNAGARSGLLRTSVRWGAERFAKNKRTVEACLKAGIATGELPA